MIEKSLKCGLSCCKIQDQDQVKSVVVKGQRMHHMKVL